MAPRRRLLVTAGLLAVAVTVGLLVSPAATLAGLAGVVFEPWFPAVLVGLYLLRPFLAWPITVLSVLVGYRYGLLVGVPIALAGAVTTSLIPYGVARTLPRADGWFARFAGGSERFFATTGDLRGVVAARLAPTPAEAISGAAGAARVSVPAFVVGTLLGELPWTIAAVGAGTALPRLSADGVAGVDPDPHLAVAAALLAGLLLAGPAYRRFAGRGPTGE